MSIFESSKRVRHRAVFPWRVHGRASVFSWARRSGSGVPPARKMTWKRSGGRRLTISFAVRFCAFVFASSTNDGVNTVIIKVFLGYVLLGHSGKPLVCDFAVFSRHLSGTLGQTKAGSWPFCL